MKISANFVGGNIEVLHIADGIVTVERELRDSASDWFYWAFCVTEAAGQTVTFRFESVNRIGYWGAAVSHDRNTWEWTGQCEKNEESESFTYRFGADENEVYFAHDMLYSPERFERFSLEYGLNPEPFCTDRKGRSVPCVRFGTGEKKLLLTARHHACESTGSYVLEGVLSGLLKRPPTGYEVLCVPFVDYDGVMDGDQGKGRIPHDHNRDYPIHAPSIYPSCAAIRAFAEQNPVALHFDFHSPWHIGRRNDKVFLVYGMEEKTEELRRFGSILEGCITDDSLCYQTKNDILPNEEWNRTDSATCVRYLLKTAGTFLGVSLETTYFGEEGNVVSQSKLIALGKCVANAIRLYAELIG